MPVTAALYPGKFDPFHNGHLDVVHRAAALFDRLVVAVYAAPGANVLFDAPVRADLVRRSVADLPQVEVVTYTGLTVDCARECSARVIVRGLRNIADYEYECQVGMANRRMAPDTELCLLITRAEYMFLSATILKEVASLQGEIGNWAPAASVQALQAVYAGPEDEPDAGRRVARVRSKMSP